MHHGFWNVFNISGKGLPPINPSKSIKILHDTLYYIIMPPLSHKYHYPLIIIPITQAINHPHWWVSPINDHKQKTAPHV